MSLELLLDKYEKFGNFLFLNSFEKLFKWIIFIIFEVKYLMSLLWNKYNKINQSYEIVQIYLFFES